MKMLLAVCLVATLMPGRSHAYEVRTHDRITEIAVGKSRIATDVSLLADLGLASSQDAVQRYPSIQSGNVLTVAELLREGARLEDGTSPRSPRVRAHFFNPLGPPNLYFASVDGTALFACSVVLCPDAPAWALEDGLGFKQGAVLEGQDFSYRDARDYYRRALTEALPSTRNDYTGRTFEALGHVVHLIQDMAQPAHVRADNHLGSDFIAGGGYENFTQAALDGGSYMGSGEERRDREEGGAGWRGPGSDRQGYVNFGA